MKAEKRRQPRAIYLLNQVNQIARGRLDGALGPLKMTGLQFTILSVIGRHDGLSSAELSRRFFVTPQTMNELIAGLEQRKLISKSPQPTNRRILQLTLTDDGRAMVRASEAVADAIEQEIFGFLPSADYENLHALVQQVLRNALQPVAETTP